MTATSGMTVASTRPKSRERIERSNISHPSALIRAFCAGVGAGYRLTALRRGFTKKITK
jgi:hypothetical protein